MTDRLGQNAIQVLASGGIRRLSPLSGGGGGGTGIKWHPGHYGASLVRTNSTNSQLSTKQQEVATVLAAPNLLGLMTRYQWPSFQHTSDPLAFDFTAFDADYTLITGISKPGDPPTGKRMFFQLMIDNFTNAPQNVVPPFIYNDPGTYGAASNGIAGTGGYCKYSAGGIVAALWRTNVQAKMNALITKIGQHPTKGGYTVDTDPWIEGFMSWEIAAVVAGAVAGSDWNETAMLTQTKSAIDTVVAAFPTTNKFFENNYAANAAQTVAIHQYLQQHGCGFGGPDIWGKSLIDGTGTPHGTINNLTWGQQVFCGSTTTAYPAGNQDLRGLMPCAHEIEDAELVGYQFGPYTPDDIMQTIEFYLSKQNNGGGVTHALWDIIPGNSPAVVDPVKKINIGTNPGNIGSILTMINTPRPIPFTGKPANYTAINTA